MAYDETRKCRKPRVAVVGAGLAGLSAASRLKSIKDADFELIVLEGSHRIGGRICTSEFAGERVELGATWIHGIEGSPLYEIAEQSGALKGDMPWECMDGFPARPIVKVEGGYIVDQAIVEPVEKLYKRLIREAQIQQENQLKEASTDRAYDAFARTSNLGSYLKMRLNDFLSEQEKTSEKGLLGSYANGSLVKKANGVTDEVLLPAESSNSDWSLRSLLEGVFSVHENSERSETAAESLYDLDLPSFGEYWEFPGKQITIAKGFSSVIHSLASFLPPGTIQFGKIVETIRWSNCSQNCRGPPPVQLHCRDGSIIEADHVILTVSLGVLKSRTTASKGHSDASAEATMISHFNNSCNIQNFRSNVDNPIEGNHVTHVELFQPHLPPWKLDAINRLGFGVVDKVFTLVELPPGDSHSHMQFIYKSTFNQEESTIPSWMRKTSSLYPIHSNSHVLLAWFVGKEALQMEALSDDKIAKAIVSTLSEFGYCQKSIHSGYGSPREACKQLAPKNGDDKDHANGTGVKMTSKSNGYYAHCRIKHSKWGTDPLFLGSYSYIASGSSGVDVDVLAEPVPRKIDHKNSEQNVPALQILFAGEATHRYHYSTTHGAYFSGLREADRLLSYYGWLT
ncbi:hypothetical protein O6H91_15G018300 [Diphasiastrum complanatum]|uniref:Uncharacterized protein n=1 Tax=Diphasiastrum complanatum TaxID=34168 RepID=A0ACC2BG22_DIPCM|nr:hypothetical protein O6H91_15G018300 [Diphasiastrum complanatum]